MRQLLLRSAEQGIDTDYGAWRIDNALPFVRIGLVASLLNWSVYLSVVWLLRPEAFRPVLPTVLGLAVPLILLALVLTFIPAARRSVMPATALSNLVAGSIIAWQIHEMTGFPGAPELTSVVNIILMFFGFIIFRMPPLLAASAITPYLALTLYLLAGDVQSGRIGSLTYWGHTVTQLVAYMNGILVAVVLEIVTRRAYAGHRLIADQQQRLEENQALIQRYVPQAVAKHIVAGQGSALGEPQRRRVTMLFADIAGFTDMADRVEPEVMTEVLGDHLSIMARIIDAHGGTLNEFAGDGLMALFGAPDPMPPEQQVRAAIAAAREMQARMPGLNQSWRKLGLGTELAIRIGINTGMVSVGSYGSEGRKTYTAIGLQTNIAARIESAAEPGQILISEASYQLIDETLGFEARGEVACKGVHFPVKVYRDRGAEGQVSL